MKLKIQMMFAVVLCVLGIATAKAEQLDHWEFVKGDTITDGEWTLTVSLRNTDAPGLENTKEMWLVGGCSATPAEPGVLDLSKPIDERSGVKYAITDLGKYSTIFPVALRGMVRKIILPTTNQFKMTRGFVGCTNLTEVVPFLPANCTEICESAFENCPKLAMPLVYKGSSQFVAWSMFKDSGITSVDLSESTVTNVNRACFAGCTSLTNASFPATLKILTGGMAPFTGCISLKKVEFRSYVGLDMFGGYSSGSTVYPACTGLAEVHFYDCVPATTPVNVYNNAKLGPIATFLHVSDAQAAVWAQYTQGGELNNDSTWSKSCAGNNYTKRPLVRYFERHMQVAAGQDAVVADDQKGVFVISRGDGESSAGDLTVNYTIGGMAVAGTDYIALPGSVKIPSGTASVNVEVTGIYTGLSSSKPLTLTLAPGDYTVVDAKSTATINVITIHREASVAKVRDADMGTGQIGQFLISRGPNDSKAGDFVVSYTVGGTAEAGVAYADDLTGTITIPAGQDSVILEVAPLDDKVGTGDTTVAIQLLPVGYDIGTSGAAEINVVHADSFGGWIYSNGVVSNSLWSFAATVNNTKHTMDVGKVSVSPGVVSPLDFTTAVIGADGTHYRIISFACGFVWQGQSQYISYAGFAEYVGSLALPEGVTTINNYSFGCLTNASGILKLPSTLTSIGRYAFKDSTYEILAADFPQNTLVGEGSFKNTNVRGDLYLPMATSIEGSFENCKDLTSVHLGPYLTKITGGYSGGAFFKCQKLTNVVFDVNSTVQITPGGSFQYCTSLTELDLTCVSKIYPPNNANNTNSVWYAPFTGCSALKKITLGPKLKNLHHLALYTGSTNLSDVVFLGPPPEFFGVPYLRNETGRISGKTFYPTITTWVDNKMVSVTNSLGKCWLDYSANGEIGRRNTTLAQEYIEWSSAEKPMDFTWQPPAATRPLRLLRPAGFLVVRQVKLG